ncbi:NAPDH-dependent diflavin reductase [Microbotryomycetes sp. JL201]|nr:NAPDH-dependent diflavin reductase [Microbotryomycetes sp. JL201]
MEMTRFLGSAQLKLLDLELVVFVLPTTGNGAPPASFVPLWTALLHPQLPSDFLEDLRYAVFALGDSSYAKYNWVGKKMSRRLDSLGARAVVDLGEADDQNEWGVESTFPQWMDQLFAKIDNLHPLPQGVQPTPEHETPPARVRMRRIADQRAAKRTRPMWAGDARWARIGENARVTAQDWFQDVRSLELRIEDVSAESTLYEAGDVLEIKPENAPEDVERFLSSAGWTDIADDYFEFSPSNADQPLAPHLPRSYIATLRQILTEELDVSSVPRVSFFEWLAAFSEGDMQEKLRYFCTGEGQDELIEYTLRPRRTINEVMYEFRSSNVPPEYVFDLLPPIRPRGFSISSSPAAHDGKVDLLVAIVRYRTILSVPRKGLCTSYLSRLSAGDRLQVRFDKSGVLRLPPNKAPLIMVGPGTGVAPFRALMEERKRVGARENLLFFGCRSVEKDFYFREQWEQFKREGVLTLSVAPSRDQDDKVYVQHKIPEFARQIWDYIERGGYIYVCGSSTQMPRSVKKALLNVFCLQGQMTETEAEQFWERLDKEGRIREETWG